MLLGSPCLIQAGVNHAPKVRSLGLLWSLCDPMGSWFKVLLCWQPPFSNSVLPSSLAASTSPGFKVFLNQRLSPPIVWRLWLIPSLNTFTLLDSLCSGQACIEGLQCWSWQSLYLPSLWVELCPTVCRSWVVTYCYSCLQDPSHNTFV